ncbi:MAG: hypothetical protein FJ265_18890 [Planctomycetes bacterium]|nr:hypothetical protein [Planctomycetota bacterium]
MPRVAFPLAFALLYAACGAPPASSAPKQPPADLTLAGLQPLQLKNLALPAPGLITSGQPTEAQFEALVQRGVRHVIQLRVVNEPGTGWEEAKAKALGVRFVRLPIAGGDGLTVDNAQRLAAELQQAGSDPVLLACASSNRVGALLALKAFHVDGVSAEQALALGKAAGLKALEPAVAARLQK